MRNMAIFTSNAFPVFHNVTIQASLARPQGFDTQIIQILRANPWGLYKYSIILILPRPLTAVPRQIIRPTRHAQSMSYVDSVFVIVPHPHQQPGVGRDS